ncbi:MAG: winged helix-turn-helix domain-containing protein [Acidobacteria bacterium]|nr:winged helix-turn-helix domain-containing protein [Acidobacteriota bacterium]
MTDPVQQFEFDNYRVDAARRLLFRDGAPVPLPPKVFDLLLYLLQHSDCVVRKSELMGALWPDTAVEDSNLTQSVFLLRKGLREGPRDHRYLVTVPGRGYRFVAEVREQSGSHGTVARHFSNDRHIGPGRIGSIVVLPFRGLNLQAHDEYLGLGIADNLTAMLGGIPQFEVRPSDALFRYDETVFEPLRAGRELGVDFLVHGTLQRSGDRLRIIVHFLAVKEARLLWAETLEEKATEIFVLQDAVTQRVGQALALKFNLEGTVPVPERRTDSTDAYQAYLKGHFFWCKRTPGGYNKAIQCFRQACSRDPDFVEAKAGLAYCYNTLAAYNVIPPLQAWPVAKAFARECLQSGAHLAQAHVSIVPSCMAFDRDWPTAEQHCRKALELNPRYPTAYDIYAEYLASQGSLDLAIEAIRRAQELDPLSLFVNRDVGVMLYLARRYSEAIEQLQDTLELDPEFGLAHESLGWALERVGRTDEAVFHFRKAVQLSGGTSEALAEIGFAYGASRQEDQARSILEELSAPARNSYVSPFDMALVHAGLGENDQTLHWLEQAFEHRTWRLIYLKTDPHFDPLRSSARFDALLHRSGLG